MNKQEEIEFFAELRAQLSESGENVLKSLTEADARHRALHNLSSQQHDAFTRVLAKAEELLLVQLLLNPGGTLPSDWIEGVKPLPTEKELTNARQAFFEFLNYHIQGFSGGSIIYRKILNSYTRQVLLILDGLDGETAWNPKMLNFLPLGEDGDPEIPFLSVTLARSGTLIEQPPGSGSGYLEWIYTPINEIQPETRVSLINSWDQYLIEKKKGETK